MKIEDKELVSTRDFSREYADRLQALNAKQIKKIVLVKSGTVEGVVVTAAEYERLTRK